MKNKLSQKFSKTENNPFETFRELSFSIESSFLINTVYLRCVYFTNKPTISYRTVLNATRTEENLKDIQEFSVLNISGE